MKLKTLAGLCKREGMIRLLDRAGEDGEVTGQWLGTVGAAYPLSGLPYLTEEAIVTLFDITGKQREKMTIMHTRISGQYKFEDADSDESVLDREKITINYGGVSLLAYTTGRGMRFINSDYLAPLMDVADELELYERRTTDGEVYFAAKVGFMLVGVIMPYDLYRGGFITDIERLAWECRRAFDLNNGREKNREDEGALEQYNMSSDGDFGEHL